MPWTLSAFSDEAGPSCSEQIAALRQAGLKFIDIRNIDGHNITSLPLDQAKKIREQLDAAAIKVNMFGSPLGKIDVADDLKIDLDKLRHMAALAPILGCNAVRMFSYYNNKSKLPFAEFQKIALQNLQQLKTLAADLGMVLYHENEAHIFGDKAADVLTIAQQLRDSKTFKMIFDFGNFNAGKEDVWNNWLLLRDVTDAIHLKDNIWQDDKLHHTPVGLGNGQVRKILADAAARKWQGPLTVEPHLQHSAAVTATGPSGIPNQSYAKMTANECFQTACAAAKSLIAPLTV